VISVRKPRKRHAGGPGGKRPSPQHIKVAAERAAEIAAAWAILIAAERLRMIGVWPR